MKKSSTAKKLFIGSSSAMLIATAIAPVVSAASFTDVLESNSHKQAIESLADLNIISGYDDGSFKPTKTLSRSNVVKMMGKWLQSIGHDIPQDYKTNLRFTDFNENTDDELLQYGALVKELGVFKGYDDGSLGASGNITRENMAIVLVRAYDAIHETNLVEYVQSQQFTKDVIDKDKAKTEAHPYIDVFDYFDITNPEAPNFRPKETTTRAQFASFLFRTINTELPIEEVSSVLGTTTIINANTANQFLGFNVNNAPGHVESLVEAGYTVEFQSTSNGIIIDSATGKLASNLAKDSTFQYKVLVSKDGTTVESDLITVQVLDFSEYAEEITEVSITQGTTKVESGKISIANGTTTVKATKATTIDGTTKANPVATYTSSNPAVASVNATTGVVTPISTGTVTITIVADGATKTVPLTVVANARKAQTITANATTAKLFQGQTQMIDLEVKDQYGDNFTGRVTTTSADEAIATTNTSAAITDGKGTLTITAVAEGNTTVDVKADDTVFATINTQVSNDRVVTSRKIETVQASDDFSLDIVKGSTDNTVNLVWNTYNASDYFIGAETALNSTYTVTSSNPDVATITTDENGVITVTAVAAGLTDIVIKEGSVVRETRTITVVDTTPTIATVTFEEVEPITAAGALNVAVVKPAGIQLSSDEYTAAIAANGTIYIDVNENAKYNPVADIKLGNIHSNFSGNATNIQNLAIAGGSVTAANISTKTDGTIIVSVTKSNETEPFALKTISVNVK